MFVSHEDTYYSEYIVMVEALRSSGYTVDVRSSSASTFSIYMLPNGTDISATANSLSGSSYAQFTQQFQDLTGSPWNSELNVTPAFANTNGRIQDVANMSSYDALIIVGGTGALDYRVDGTYSSQGIGARLVTAAEIQASAEKLNALALEALMAGKPVMAQCHGASIPVFWRIPDTTGPGDEALGYSLLKDQYATGFPEAQTGPTLAALNVNYRPDDRVMVSSPHSSFNDNDNGDYKIVTTRDWYPQTVLYGARTLLNIIETYPTSQQMQSPVSVLILHGGAINSLDCGAGNRANDVPCNYGTGANLPADYTDIQSLLGANSPNDPYSFTVNELNVLSASLPYDPTQQASILSYLYEFDVVIFFKHWSTGVTTALQNALVSYADNGFGVFALHHGLYNDIDGALNKDILANQLFGASSAMNTWSANLTNYNVFSTNNGHFISTYGINYPIPLQAPAIWVANPLISGANASFSYYQRFPVFDEIYNNMTFLAGQTFGRGINQITTLFSNDLTPNNQTHTSGFLKLFDPSMDGSVGKVAYFGIGERKENINITHLNGQIIRNAVAWLAIPPSTPLPVTSISFDGECVRDEINLNWVTASEINNQGFEIQNSADGVRFDSIGYMEGSGTSIVRNSYQFSTAPIKKHRYFRLKQIDHSSHFEYSSVISIAGCYTGKQTVYPNPVKDGRLHIKGMAKQIVIHTTQGIEVMRTDRLEKESIDISHFPEGIYVVGISWYDQSASTTKIIVDHSNK